MFVVFYIFSENDFFQMLANFQEIPEADGQL